MYIFWVCKHADNHDNQRPAFDLIIIIPCIRILEWCICILMLEKFSKSRIHNIFLRFIWFTTFLNLMYIYLFDLLLCTSSNRLNYYRYMYSFPFGVPPFWKWLPCLQNLPCIMVISFELFSVHLCWKNKGAFWVFGM